MASVNMENIAKSFGKTSVVNNLNLKIEDGEFITLLGPSGCGKSTTLNMIAGLEQSTSGKIFLDDEDVTSVPPGKRDIAMVFQSYALYPHLTVFDNIAFPLSARKVDAAEIKKLVGVTAEKLELGALLERYPRELSGGQRQRVALGRAIVRTPKIFLFDEPLSNLDAALKITTRSEIKKLHQDLKSTMIYVTHDQAEAMSLSDRIAILSGGQLQQFAPPEEVYARPANLFVATFIGNPGMNLWSGKIKDKHLQVNDTTFTLPENLGNHQEITIGIRPQHIVLAHEKASNAIPVEVITYQHMGECNFLDVTMAGKRTIVRTETSFTAKPGDSLFASYENQNAHCFDVEGKRIN